MTTSALVDAVRTALRAAADPALAPGMQAYMRSEQPYLGVRRPDVRRLTLAAARDHAPASLLGLGAAATDLWRQATYREERYAALELTGTRPVSGALELLPLYQEMITTGAWWDHVDGTSPRIGDLLLTHPETMTPLLHDWARDPDRWLRRSAVIAQLRAKDRTDTGLLADVITANAADPDFFLRKGIGWALRQYARTDPVWVRRFLDTQPLSPLSRREAAKHLR